MKMDSMNISLPGEMAEFVRREVQHNYGNISEFFRDLVREKIKREIDADLALLEATIHGGEAGPTEVEIEQVVALQKKLRKARNAGGV
jgi:Arc/MetJ-type ribon-helix-helix transcriptional regulator